MGIFPENGGSVSNQALPSITRVASGIVQNAGMYIIRIHCILDTVLNNALMVNLSRC